MFATDVAWDFVGEVGMTTTCIMLGCGFWFWLRGAWRKLHGKPVEPGPD